MAYDTRNDRLFLNFWNKCPEILFLQSLRLSRLAERGAGLSVISISSERTTNGPIVKI